MSPVDAGMVRVLRPLLRRAMRKALRDRFGREELGQLVRATWQKYEVLARDLPLEATLGARVMVRMAAVPWKFTAVLARNPLRRVQRVMDLLMWFPYASPGYQMRYVQTGKEAVAFDVHRCPAADYFGRHGLSDLCVAAFCNLDYPLAARWSVELHRSQTIASGASRCDFRFVPSGGVRHGVPGKTGDRESAAAPRRGPGSRGE